MLQPGRTAIMPDFPRTRGNAVERAAFHASLTETRGHGHAALDQIRDMRARHIRILESMSVERRILREDYDHWDDHGA
jgi:hypothetical protein